MASGSKISHFPLFTLASDSRRNLKGPVPLVHPSPKELSPVAPGTDILLAIDKVLTSSPQYLQMNPNPCSLYK